MNKVILISALTFLPLMIQSGLSMAGTDPVTLVPPKALEQTVAAGSGRNVRSVSTSERQRLLRERRAARRAVLDSRQTETTSGKVKAEAAAGQAVPEKSPAQPQESAPGQDKSSQVAPEKAADSAQQLKQG
ncbi:MAG: hypothetical protein KDI44_11950 [Thiothrix sp.]|nr:hypothetical protein [Thiothrix sp.]